MWTYHRFSTFIRDKGLLARGRLLKRYAAPAKAKPQNMPTNSCHRREWLCCSARRRPINPSKPRHGILLLTRGNQAGHTVIGSVRSVEKGEELLSVHPEWKDNLSFAIVSDFTATGTWVKTFQEHDLDYVVHVAAPAWDDPTNTDFDKDFLEPSVKG